MAIVAVARKLLTLIWTLLTRGEPYRAAIPFGPRSRGRWNAARHLYPELQASVLAGRVERLIVEDAPLPLPAIERSCAFSSVAELNAAVGSSVTTCVEGVKNLLNGERSAFRKNRVLSRCPKGHPSALRKAGNNYLLDNRRPVFRCCSDGHAKTRKSTGRGRVMRPSCCRSMSPTTCCIVGVADGD